MIPSIATYIVRLARVGFIGLAVALACPLSVWAQSTYRLQIFPLGGFMPAAINNKGQVAGAIASADPFGRDAVIWKDGMIEVLGPGATRAINERGQVAGIAPDRRNADAVRATRWGPLGRRTLGQRASFAEGINDRGEVVGVTYGPDALPYATLWSRGETISLGIGDASAIDNSSRVVGYYQASTYDPIRAAMWQAGTITLLGGPGSAAAAINDLGSVVGYQGNWAYLWESGAAIDLGGPEGSVGSQASAINLRGDVVGSFVSGFGPDGQHAALWRKSGSSFEVFDLNGLLRPGAHEAGWVLIGASRSNDHGAIVGQARHLPTCDEVQCAEYGFLLTHSTLPDEYPIPTRP